jgi:hypothetical protein
MALWPLLILACTDSDSKYQNPVKTTDSWALSSATEVDVLWVIDDTTSMEEVQRGLGTGIEAFAEVAARPSAGVQLRLGITTTSLSSATLRAEDGCPAALTPSTTCPDPAAPATSLDYLATFAARVNVGTGGESVEQGLAAGVAATEAAIDFLRPDAELLVVFVSDEEDCSNTQPAGTMDNLDCYNSPRRLTPVSELVTAYQALRPSPTQVRLSAISGPSFASPACSETTLPGLRYIEASLSTGGRAESICTTDWSGTMSRIAESALGLSSSFQLSHVPLDGTLEVMSDEQPVPQADGDGFTYDRAANTVTLHGSYTPARGTTVEVSYERAP